MRYISEHDLDLFKNNGQIAYHFFNGVLDLGLGTINADLATPAEESLQLVYEKDLADATTSRIEMAGQGDLTDLPDGKRLFYESDILAFTTGEYTPTSGLWYEVVNGTVEYNGKRYHAGDKIKAIDTNNIADVASGQIAPTFPDTQGKPIDMRGEYWTKHLEHGDEPLDYPLHNVAGYEPRNSMTTSDEGWYGWIR